MSRCHGKIIAPCIIFIFTIRGGHGKERYVQDERYVRDAMSLMRIFNRTFAGHFSRLPKYPCPKSNFIQPQRTNAVHFNLAQYSNRL